MSSSITGLGIRDKTKGGWHPKGKDGKSRESWRGDFKGVGQVAGWMGKGKSPVDQANDHVSRPLHTLKDPSAFGPPPKNVNYHGGAALPNQLSPDRGGIGAPLSLEQIQADRLQKQAEKEAEEVSVKKSSVPYRSDTSGLSTAHLPPPPGRRDAADGRSPPVLPVIKGKPPGLPPRLPPRQNSSPIASPPLLHNSSQSEPDPHRGILNQGALNRLGNAGVSVPGFGIGTKNARPLPPPSIASPSKSSPPDVPGSSKSQLNELQSRFSRLSSSASPPSDAPAQGTTFAQKQAALKTASSFRNDPSSMSLTDAKAAASTANNFRERHGEQVTSGWQSANKLNTKYGIADKVNAYGASNNVQPVQSGRMQIDTGENAVVSLAPSAPGFLGKKKPPPPPMKKSELSGNTVGAPPPIPLANKPKPSLYRASESNYSLGNQSHELDLNLNSLWFSKSPVVLPPSIVGSRGQMHSSTSGWTSSGLRKIHTYSTIVQHNEDLSRTKIHLTWDSSNPGVTVKAQQKYIPPPRKLTYNELEVFRQSYSDAVATWCESNMGRQVGNGECWTLANDALKAVASNCNSYGTEPCLSSQSLIHGALVYSLIPAQSPYPDPRGGVLEAGVARGDIIQILKGIFKSKDGRRQQFAGDPDHTAVITSVETNGILRVVESNVGGSKNVREGAYDMSELTQGEVRIFRAVGESWVGKLDPTW